MNYKDKLDIVICLGPNDVNIINLMVNYTKNNIIGFRNIYIISYDHNIKIDGCITIDENIFPFNKDSIIHNNNKWYLQQLLKLYSSIIIDGILDNVLIIDADTIFFKKTSFFEKNIPLYSYGHEYNYCYFEHMKKLHPSLNKQDINKSGICHHLLIQKNILKELFKLIEDYHNKPFYQVFIENIDHNIWTGASEYEIYFNYILFYHSDKIKIRKLNFDNRPRNFSSISQTNNDVNNDYNYISYHHYM
jgi:hypothetical protein